MKKAILIISSLLAMQIASAQSLVVEALDGTTQVYDMAAVSKLDFTTSGSLKVVKTDKSEDVKSISETRKVVFSAENVSAVSEAESQVSALKVYPNPAKNEITVEGANADILIFSANGSLVSTTKAADKAVINVSSLADGVYVLRSGKSAARIIKTK
ncbi:MAG: T9SS type A sorting domain-containing protein [Paludibacteraceae bacterium]|nr:T9SS type A sorting domain-containing protein [Paludibacteraceae bacterium]